MTGYGTVPPHAPIPQGNFGETVLFPVIMPWGWAVGWAYQTYSVRVGYTYVFGGILQPAIPEPPPQPPRKPEPLIVFSEELPASLTMQFPSPADVWLDGKKVTTKPTEVQELTTPSIPIDRTFTFNVKARWSSGGKTYETKRAIAVKPGEQSRLLVVSGEEVEK